MVNEYFAKITIYYRMIKKTGSLCTGNFIIFSFLQYYLSLDLIINHFDIVHLMAGPFSYPLIFLVYNSNLCFVIFSIS